MPHARWLGWGFEPVDISSVFVASAFVFDEYGPHFGEELHEQGEGNDVEDAQILRPSSTNTTN